MKRQLKGYQEKYSSRILYAIKRLNLEGKSINKN